MKKHGRIHTGALLTVLSLLAATAIPATASDWPQFRGPEATGIAETSGLPAKWDSTTNIVWKSALPGAGGSSPIVIGDRVFVTAYSGYAQSIENPGNMDDLVRHVICLDRATGKQRWAKEYPAEMPESEYVGGNNTRHGYASSTPASDGKSLFVFFGRSGVFALDLDGNELWTTDVGDGTDGWGSASSLILHGDLLLVNASVECGALVALNKQTGKEVWRAEGINRTWCTPVLVETGGRTEVVMNLPNKVAAYDAASGKELWYCEGIPDGYVCPSVIAHDGIVYAIGGRRSEIMAVPAGGSGDVTDKILWRTREGNNVTSPVLVDGYLYWLHESRGIAYCVDAATGEIVYEEPLDPKPGLLYASLVAADGKLYAPSQDNGTYVLAAKPAFEQLAVNTFADDTSRVNASIVAVDGKLYMRTDKAIYCIGN